MAEICFGDRMQQHGMNAYEIVVRIVPWMVGK